MRTGNGRDCDLSRRGREEKQKTEALEATYDF